MTSRTITFDDLWQTILDCSKHRNPILHHPCCDIWTTRNSKKSRSTHSQSTSWKEIQGTLPGDCPDLKTAFHAKMVEEGWRIPALLNKPCQAHLQLSQMGKLPFQPPKPQRQVPILYPQDPDTHPLPFTPDPDLNTHPSPPTIALATFPILTIPPSQPQTPNPTPEPQTPNSSHPLLAQLVQELANLPTAILTAVSGLHTENSQENKRQLSEAIKPLSEDLGNVGSSRQLQART